MAHDLDGRDVTGEDDETAFTFAKSGLNVLQSISDVSLVLHPLLDAFVELKSKYNCVFNTFWYLVSHFIREDLFQNDLGQTQVTNNYK